MNVSMRDGFNLGWKLAAVLRGRAAPELLHTYSAERQAVAKELIDFDREFAKMFSARPKAADDSEGEGIDPAEFQRYFVMQGRFTAGTATRYRPSIITGEATHQHLARGFEIGTRFHSAPVIRLADAKPVHLGHAVDADGRWRLFAFADAADPASDGSGLAALCAFLADAPGLAGAPVHAARRGPRRGHRRPGRLPAGPSGAFAGGDARVPPAAEGAPRAARLREDVLPRPEGRRGRLRPAGRRPGTGGAS